MSREQLMRADVAIPDWLIEDLLVEDNLGVIKITCLTCTRR